MFLSPKTMIQISQVKRQLLELLSAARFVRTGLRARAVEALGRRSDGSDGVRLALREGAGGDPQGCFNCGQRGHSARECTAAARRVLLSADDAWEEDQVNLPLVKALLTASLYPRVMTAIVGPSKGGRPGSVHCHIREPDTGDVVEVAIHPSSVNARQSHFDSQYLVYNEAVKTTRVFVRDCTPVSPFALILFGGALATEKPAAAGKRGGGGAPHLLVVDEWIRFNVPQDALQLMMQVRAELDAVLRRKIEQPSEDLSAAGRHILDAVVQLISTQGH